MAKSRFPALDALIREIEEQAAGPADPHAVLVAVLKLLITRETDPFPLIGTLIEGIAASIAKGVPAERQSQASVEAMRLLRDRMRHYRLI